VPAPASARRSQLSLSVTRNKEGAILREESAFDVEVDFFRLVIMAVRVFFGRSADLADVLARFLKDVAIAVLVVRLRFFGPIFPLNQDRQDKQTEVSVCSPIIGQNGLEGV
jgi:hypothetical protein